MTFIVKSNVVLVVMLLFLGSFLPGAITFAQNPAVGIRTHVQNISWAGYHSDVIDVLEKQEQKILTGKSLDGEDLLKLQANLSMQLRSLGYLIGQIAIIPEDLDRFPTTGILRLTVFPGRVGSIQIKNSSNVDGDWIYRVAETTLCPNGVGENCVLEKGNFERMTQLLQDIAGLQVGSLDFSTDGVGIGETKITITTTLKEPVIKGSLAVDNQGFNSSGKYRLGVSALANNLLGVGDTYALDLFDTNKGTVSGALTVSGPLNSDGLRWQSSVSRSQFFVSNVNTSGFGNSASLGIAHPLLRGLDVNWLAGLNAVGVITNSETSGIVATNKTLESGQFTLDGNSGDRSILLGQNTWYFHSALTMGRVGDTANTTNSSGALGAYTKLALQGVGKYILNDNQDIYAVLNIRGQAANTNLDPYEKLLVGGFGGVRAYNPEQGSYNQGAISTIELRKTVNSQWGQFSPAIFTDYANGWLYHATYPNWQINSGYTNPNLSNHMVLSDIGLGIDWNGFYGFTVNASWATRLPASPAALNSIGNPNSQFWFSLQSRF